MNIRSQPQPIISSRLARIPFLFWLAPVLLLSFALRSFGLGTYDLWLDEAISVYIAKKSYLDIIAYCAARIQEHPPGYYLLLHTWMNLVGDSEFALRYVSTSGGVVSVATLALAARRWYGTRIAWFAALLMAVQPMAVQYGRDARMYSWLMATTLLALYALSRALASNRWRDWVLFALWIIVSLSLHYLAGLTLLAYALFLAFSWRRLGVSRWRFAPVLAVLIGAPLLWILTQPGPRSSIAMLVQTALVEPWSPARLTPILTHWALGIMADARLPSMWPLTVCAWLLATIGVIDLVPQRLRGQGDMRVLTLLLIFVPAVTGSFVFVFVIARHFSATLPMFVLALTLGCVALIRRWRTIGVLISMAVIGFCATASFAQLANHWRPFSVPMTYVNSRAVDGEPIVYTYPVDWPLNDYYNRRNLPANFVLAVEAIPSYNDSLVRLPDEQVILRISEMLSSTSSLWLSLYPGPTESESTHLESLLSEVAFPTEKTWFPGDRAVVRYFAPRPLQEQPGGPAWDTGINLSRWWTADPVVNAGDALRLQFEWRRLRTLTETVLISLSLVGPDGATWATRVSAPCNGQCPANEWPDAGITERQAFYVPPDVPPGEYTLRLSLLSANGVAWLARRTGGDLGVTDWPLMNVTVREPVRPLPPSPSIGQFVGIAMRPDLELVSVQFANPTVRAGQTLQLPMQWKVGAVQPALEIYLVLEHNDQIYIGKQPLGTAWYPSRNWSPGRLVRTQPQFTLSGLLPPGQYRASVVITPAQAESYLASGLVTRLESSSAWADETLAADRLVLDDLILQDRPRTYTLPDIGEPVAVSWGEGIQLVRAEVPASAAPGDKPHLTLVWQADRPTSENWKVYVHLLDSNQEVRAQGDAYPGDGAMPTTTWASGEVIVDRHMLELPPDLPEGNYTITWGFYDELTGERLPLQEGGDSYTWPGSFRVITR